MRISAKAAFSVADADPLHKLYNTRPCRVAGEPLMQLKTFADLLFKRVQRVERGHRLLKDKADVVAAHLSQAFVIGTDHFLPVIGHAARDLGRSAKQRHRAQRRHRLARAAFAHDGHRLAGIKAERHTLDRLDQLPVLAETDPQIFDRQKAHSNVFLGSNASRTPSKINTRSDSMMAKAKKAVNASQGA